jgi:hypothetical protein
MIARVHKSGGEIVADKGEQIYREQFQATYEKEGLLHAYSPDYYVAKMLTGLLLAPNPFQVVSESTYGHCHSGASPSNRLTFYVALRFSPYF